MDYSAAKGYDCDCCGGIDSQIDRHNIVIWVPFLWDTIKRNGEMTSSVIEDQSGGQHFVARYPMAFPQPGDLNLCPNPICSGKYFDLNSTIAMEFVALTFVQNWITTGFSLEDGGFCLPTLTR
ncbi:hypothetical protein PN441_05090 [Spirulina major CS-329]|nr:hypothetical protein [Spirulina subsalsa CS-330]MDB9502439.1 hypothetical protein [Spirulina major CS-329]